MGWYHYRGGEDLEFGRGVERTVCFSLKMKSHKFKTICTDKVVCVSTLVDIPCLDLSNAKDVVYQAPYDLVI